MTLVHDKNSVRRTSINRKHRGASRCVVRDRGHVHRFNRYSDGSMRCCQRRVTDTDKRIRAVRHHLRIRRNGETSII
ncbi:MAG TPA: hypothetical protein EYO37_11400 [Nitrospina sp.]|nr:hypothetical protein [Nitrospina sp.]